MVLNLSCPAVSLGNSSHITNISTWNTSSETTSKVLDHRDASKILQCTGRIAELCTPRWRYSWIYSHYQNVSTFPLQHTTHIWIIVQYWGYSWSDTITRMTKSYPQTHYILPINVYIHLFSETAVSWLGSGSKQRSWKYLPIKMHTTLSF